MGSKGRVPPPHLRRPLPGPGMMHPDPFGPPIRPPPGGFPPFDVMTPPEVMEQKLAGQHVEMRKLATENQRLAATHGTLRQELAAAQHELQILHSHIGAMKSEKEQQTRELIDRIGRMETELQAAESIKVELQQARAEAQNLVTVRQELISKVQQLNHDLETGSSELQQMPRLLSELEGLRQEYQHCRATYDYEKKLYNDHLEHLQAMEKNYMTMVNEVEKLRENLANTTNVDRRPGAQYGGSSGYNENNATGNYPVGQNSYMDGYATAQGGSPLPTGLSGGGAAPAAPSGGGGGGGPGINPQVGTQSGPAPARTAYDAAKGPAHDANRGSGPAYDVQRGTNTPGYDGQRGATAPGQEAQRGASYHAQRGPGYGPGYDMQMAHGYYDAQRAAGYGGHRPPVFDAQRASGYDPQKGAPYDPSKGPVYDASSRGSAGHQGQVPPANNAAPYGSAIEPTRAGTGYEAPSRGGNPNHR